MLLEPSPARRDDDFWVLFLTPVLAGVLHDQERFDEAEHFYRQALEGRRRRNPDDRFAINARNNLARVLVKQDNLDEAESLYREQLDVQRRVHGPDGVATLRAMNVLAWFLKDRGPEKLAEAEDLAREATSLARSTHAQDDRLTFRIADTLAVILHMRGKNEEAVSVFEEVPAAARKPVGNERWPFAVSLTHHVEALAELTGRTDVKIEDDEDIESLAEALIELYEAWGKPQKAAEYRDLLPEAEEFRDSD
ncbi:MAG: tetratricopeptide repeat protein [Planctomycetota bacterium]